MIVFPNINPLLFEIGPFALRWYSLAYIVGILIAWKYCCSAVTNVTSQAIEDIFFWGVLGLMIGGRLAHVLIYSAEYYIAYPMEIFQIWNGGMSFYGSCFGIIFAVILCAKKHRINLANIADHLTFIAPLGLFLGRIANFINGELYGKYTTVPWAVIFPRGGYIPRHPTQLYEAFFEGIVIFVIMNITKNKILHKPGFTFLLFMFLYNFFRFFIEFFKEHDNNIGYIGYFTIGQILSMITLCVSTVLFYFFVSIRGNVDFDKRSQ